MMYNYSRQTLKAQRQLMMQKPISLLTRVFDKNIRNVNILVSDQTIVNVIKLL